MNSLNRLTVTYRDRIVGVISMAPDAKVCTFQYHKQWLSEGFSISPTELPLSDKLFVANPEPFGGNFGIFEDSLPDGYGRYLLHRLLKRQGIDYFALSPIQLLSIVGQAGMGALTYHPETFVGEAKNLPDVDKLQQMALDTLSEKSTGGEDVLYYNSGNSGGCRPKCLYNDTEGHWLLKFRHTYDPKDIGEMEYRYMSAARECGIDVPDFKLVDGKYFAIRRFDLDADGNRMHIATAAALLRQTISPPMADYRMLLHLTGFVTQDVLMVEEMVRRMAFNVFADNKDDHAKNFTFLYDGTRWTLAPAYDLTYSPEGYNGEHATSVNYNGNPTIDDMIDVATSVRIPPKRAIELVEPIRQICASL